MSMMPARPNLASGPGWAAQAARPPSGPPNLASGPGWQAKGGPNVSLGAPQISGGLPFGGMAQAGGLMNAVASGNPYALGQQYQSSYNAALGMNAQNYQNILGGYGALMGNQVNAQNQIEGGYGALQGQVQNTLGMGGNGWGVAGPAAQSIADLYAQNSGGLSQGLVSGGLGNSTVASELQRGPALDAAKAYAGLGANLAQTYAGYQANIGEAGLNYANQANMQNTALGENQLGWMNSINSLYPNASDYSNIYQQWGQNRMAGQMMGLEAQGMQSQNMLDMAQMASQNYNQQQDRQLQMAMAGRGGGGGGQGGGMGGNPYAGFGGFGGGGGGGGYYGTGGDFGEEQQNIDLNNLLLNQDVGMA